MIFLAFILQVVFFVLKIAGAVHWAWPVVLIPLWIALIFIAIRAVLVALAAAAAYLALRKRRIERQRSRKRLGW